MSTVETPSGTRKEQIDALKYQIVSASKRCDEAYANWDQEAYDGACNSGIRAQVKLDTLYKEVIENQELLGVCSTCQASKLELIHEHGYILLAKHEAFGRHCQGSYDPPETTYWVNKKESKP